MTRRQAKGHRVLLEWLRRKARVEDTIKARSALIFSRSQTSSVTRPPTRGLNKFIPRWRLTDEIPNIRSE